MTVVHFMTMIDGVYATYSFALNMSKYEEWLPIYQVDSDWILFQLKGSGICRNFRGRFGHIRAIEGHLRPSKATGFCPEIALNATVSQKIEPAKAERFRPIYGRKTGQGSLEGQ